LESDASKVDKNKSKLQKEIIQLEEEKSKLERMLEQKELEREERSKTQIKKLDEKLEKQFDKPRPKLYAYSDDQIRKLEKDLAAWRSRQEEIEDCNKQIREHELQIKAQQDRIKTLIDEDEKDPRAEALYEMQAFVGCGVCDEVDENKVFRYYTICGDQVCCKDPKKEKEKEKEKE